jgi:hypothetical protein
LEDQGADGRIILKWTFMKLGWVGMDWIDLAFLDIDRWRVLINAVANSRLPYNEGNC